MIVTYTRGGESFETDFDIGDRVYLVTDPEQRERIITTIQVYPSNFAYQVSMGTESSFHYEFELSLEKDEFKSLGMDVSQ